MPLFLVGDSDSKLPNLTPILSPCRHASPPLNLPPPPRTLVCR